MALTKSFAFRGQPNPFGMKFLVFRNGCGFLTAVS
jgi:hypothetical protein